MVPVVARYMLGSFMVVNIVARLKIRIVVRATQPIV